MSHIERKPVLANANNKSTGKTAQISMCICAVWALVEPCSEKSCLGGFPPRYNTNRLLVWLLFNVPVNKFSVMLGRSLCFLGIYQYFGELKNVLLTDTTWRSWGSNPGVRCSTTEPPSPNCAADLCFCFRIYNQRTNGPVNAHLTISQV